MWVQNPQSTVNGQSPPTQGGQVQGSCWQQHLPAATTWNRADGGAGRELGFICALKLTPKAAGRLAPCLGAKERPGTDRRARESKTAQVRGGATTPRRRRRQTPAGFTGDALACGTSKNGVNRSNSRNAIVTPNKSICYTTCTQLPKPRLKLTR